MNEIRRLGDDELSQIQPLFHRVFGHSISIELLKWKYSSGRGESWVMQSSPENIALHCGLVFRDVLLAGQPTRVAQLVDLIASAKGSGLSRSQSPFRLLMQAILAGLPRADNPAGVAFGFPSGRAMRLGEHLGVYQAVDRWFDLKFESRHSNRFSPAAHELHVFGADEARVADRLWGRMARDLQDNCVGVRNAQFFRQRYLQRPERRYTLLQVDSRWLRRPIGLAAIRPGDVEFELLDIVGAWEDMPDILRAIQAWLAETPGKTLIFSLTASFAAKLQFFADSCEETQFRIMANPLTPDSILAKLENRWWLTGGDTDYR